MMRALLALPLIVALGACGTAEDTAIETVSLHEGAQVETCRLDDTVCGSVVLREMIGTPNLLKAYLIRRVGNTAVIDRVLEIANPNVTANKEFTLVIRNFANEGNYYLAVTLEVTTSRTGNLDASSELTAPAWTHESIAHIDASSFDIHSASRRGNSWFEARDNRLTAPAPIAEMEYTDHHFLGEDQFVDLPNLRGRYDLEYIGWSSVFNLDGTATNVGIIELQRRLDRDVPFDHVQFPMP
jgi:hypothetical protein